jgi:hypothetical protein
LEKKLFFVGILKATDEKRRVRSPGAGSISQRYGSPDPDPYLGTPKCHGSGTLVNAKKVTSKYIWILIIKNMGVSDGDPFRGVKRCFSRPKAINISVKKVNLYLFIKKNALLLV